MDEPVGDLGNGRSGGGGSGLRIGGWAKLSTCDWPGRLVTTVFTQGCPWRCAYCHNQELLAARSTLPTVPWAAVVAHLRRRRGLLDGVVFSGGEPLLQHGLAAAMSETHRLGFAVGLHTSGVNPRRFGRLLDERLVDWVGLDIKAAPDAYDRVTGVRNSAAPAARSLRLLLRSGVDHQIRTTVDPALLTPDDIAALRRWLHVQGVHGHVLQPARSRPTAASTGAAAATAP